MDYEKVFIITDGCMWEINKQTGNEHPHAMEVVDIETGAIRYIKSGSRIMFVEGEITDIRTQKAYEKKSSQVQRKMSSDAKDKSNRRGSKEIHKKTKFD